MILSNLESNVLIPCRTSGYPRPETYWIDNFEKRINPKVNSRYSILENGDLFIENITWQDMGSFLCVAKSEDSEVSADTFLYPLKVTFNFFKHMNKNIFKKIMMLFIIFKKSLIINCVQKALYAKIYYAL